MKKTLTGVLLAVLLLCTACGQKESVPTWQDQYDLGVRYLSDGNYEEAIIAFTAAIEIDPKQTEAYIGLANAYLAQGDTDASRRVIEDAIAAVGEDAVRSALEEKYLDDEWGYQTVTLPSMSEVTFMGQSIQNITIAEMKNLAAQNGYEVTEREEDDHWWFTINSENGYSGADMSAAQYYNAPRCDFWSYDHAIDDDSVPFDIGIRGIQTHDSIETVLSKLGVKELLPTVEEIKGIIASFPDDIASPIIERYQFSDHEQEYADIGFAKTLRCDKDGWILEWDIALDYVTGNDIYRVSLLFEQETLVRAEFITWDR